MDCDREWLAEHTPIQTHPFKLMLPILITQCARSNRTSALKTALHAQNGAVRSLRRCALKSQNGAEPWPRHVDNSTENSTGTRQLLDSYSQMATRQDTRQVPVLARQDSLQCTRFYRWFWTRLQKLCTGSFAVAALSDAKRQCKLHVPKTVHKSKFVKFCRSHPSTGLPVQYRYRYRTVCLNGKAGECPIYSLPLREQPSCVRSEQNRRPHQKHARWVRGRGADEQEPSMVVGPWQPKEAGFCVRQRGLLRPSV